MKYLLDTNTCIRYLNGRSETIKNNLLTTQPKDIVLCSVVKAELFYGVEKSQQVERNVQRIRRFVSQFVSLPFDDQASETYAKIRSQLEIIGTPIGPNDLLIAAIAVTRDLILVTHNTSEFERVENLRLEDWEV